MSAADVRAPAEGRRRHRAAMWGALVAAIVVAVGVGVAVFALSGGESAAPRAQRTTPSRHTAEAVLTAPNVSLDLGRVPFRAAATKGNDIPVFATPDVNAAPMDMLSTQTEYYMPRTLLAFDQWQDWLHVYLPTRPNNSTGWVKTSDVDVSAPLEWWVRVSLADHHLWLFHNGAVEFETGVAIGVPQYPTPTGTFYFTDPLDLHDRPNLGYGVFAIGLSGHSDVLTDFAGGDGQIGIHGTNNPGDIGRDVSHGCVRVTNDAIERLSTLPLGTPVTIV